MSFSIACLSESLPQIVRPKAVAVKSPIKYGQHVETITLAFKLTWPVIMICQRPGVSHIGTWTLKIWHSTDPGVSHSTYQDEPLRIEISRVIDSLDEDCLEIIEKSSVRRTASGWFVQGVESNHI